MQLQQQAASNQQAPYHFRQANNGYYVFPTSDKKEADNNDNDKEIGNYLQHLAAFSRGNLSVAQVIWRDSLRVEPDQELTEKQDDEDQAPAGRTIWVTPWENIEQPALPSNAAEKFAFVLHTLLLHNGLPITLLQQLLPLAGSQVMETIYQLAEARLVARQDDVWRVTARGYPVVRGFLQENGYLYDTF